MNKVPNGTLLAAGLELMAQSGQPLTRVPTKGRAMIYGTSDGKTVRVRTCNDHILVVLADSPDEGAHLNIEGTDYLLIVMPQAERSYGPIIAYLVPTPVAVDAARTTHRDWLATNPNTKGDNRTWNIWFDDDGPSKAHGFAKKWAKYRLGGTSITTSSAQAPAPVLKLGEVIAAAKRQIADVAGVSPEAVRISVDLT
jgi:hypothetical protein